MVIFDKEGNVSWQLKSDEIGGVLKDVCGLQVLKNGNFHVSCYGNTQKDEFKMMEISRDKKIVWTYKNESIRNVHNLQVLTTNQQVE